jgi:hypothetical protein
VGRFVSSSRTDHVILASAESKAYASLRERPTPRAERYAMGRALRQQVPRSSLGQWAPPVNRFDPVDLINQSHEGRLDWLVRFGWPA